MARTRSISNTDLLKAAICFLLEDEGFQMLSGPAKQCFVSAKQVDTWSSNPTNKDAFRKFSDDLVDALSECFQPGQIKSLKKQRERMWESYHHIRCSNEFKTLWIDFLAVVLPDIEEFEPILYQFLSDKVFEQLIVIQFPLSKQQSSVDINLDITEKRALRYTAGYVVYALKKMVTRSAHPLKERIELCLCEMNELDELQHQDESEVWTKVIDRGGLTHVSDMVYSVFADMEVTLRQYLGTREAEDKIELTRVKRLIVANEDVMFDWSIIAINWDSEEDDALLDMIVEHWLTVRGFSLASSFMEKYKHENKKNVQKSKGIRKQLIGTASTN